MKIPNWAIFAVIGVVCVAWIFTIITSAINPNYHAPDSVNAIFSAIAGAAVSRLAFRGKGDDDDDEDKEK